MERLRDTSVYEDDLASALRNLEDAELPLELAGEFCEETTSLRRVLAICRLLREADVDGFHHELLRSALSRRYYLARCQRQGYADHFTVASRTEPFFDALAAGNLALARELARLAAPGPRQGEEYPEDYHYANLLYRHVLLGGQDEAGELEQLQATLEAHQDGARVDLCRSLLARDGRAFEAAFQALLEERANEVACWEARFMDTASTITNAHVFVEGLAWMRLAEHTRPPLPVVESCHFCPALARMPMQRPFPFQARYVRGRRLTPRACWTSWSRVPCADVPSRPSSWPCAARVRRGSRSWALLECNVGNSRRLGSAGSRPPGSSPPWGDFPPSPQDFNTEQCGGW